MILAEDPKCSGRVNLSKQSTKEVGADIEFSLRSLLPGGGLVELPILELGDGPKSSEMSQKGSTVVDTPLFVFYKTIVQL